MSADRDRGTRRQKQKRAKQLKKLGRRAPAPVTPAPAKDSAAELPVAASAQ